MRKTILFLILHTTRAFNTSHWRPFQMRLVSKPKLSSQLSVYYIKTHTYTKHKHTISRADSVANVQLITCELNLSVMRLFTLFRLSDLRFHDFRLVVFILFYSNFTFCVFFCVSAIGITASAS